ncbi:hypothetical protein PYCCODRAFT_1425293 [Trametes coccinea BRFM310]|uniref:Uncharacterized protein n=1 Tax=Trametes coccinea (strain BRFM310) TaxID=1353009 RepID=A0A1Y2IMV5_TRAC3|nr:hypothetical protein PYCCODRAFT_1425293 [Trametes coccinea BRFM310]
MSFLHPAIAHVYTYDAAEDKLTSELMRIPSGCPGYRRSTSPASKATNTTTLRTLGKDTQGLIEVVPIGRGEIVYFVERGRARKSVDLESSGSESESEKENASVGRSRAVRQAMRKVREVELLARKMDEEMMAMQEAQKELCAGDAALEASNDEDESEDEDDDDDDDEDYDDDDDESEDEDEDVSVVVEERVAVEKHVAVVSEDEDESGDDDEEAYASMMSVVEEMPASASVVNDEDEDEDEWELCDVRVQNRVAELTNNGDAWEDSLFGRYQDDAGDAGAEDATVEDQQQQQQLEKKSRIDNLKPEVAEQWTAPEDWESPIQALPSTEFNVFKFGFGATLPPRINTIIAEKADGVDLVHANIDRAPRKTKKWTLPDVEPGTPTRADRMVHSPRADQVADARTRTRADAHEDPRADPRMVADARTRADPRTRTEADQRTRTNQRIEPRIQADASLSTRADQRTRMDASAGTRADPRTRTEAYQRPRTDARTGAPRTQADQRTRTNAAPKEPTRKIMAKPADSMIVAVPRTRTAPGTSADRKARTYTDRTTTKPRTPEPIGTRTMVPTRITATTGHGARTNTDQLPRADTNSIACSMISYMTITKQISKMPAARGDGSLRSVDVRANSSGITARSTTSTAVSAPAMTQNLSRGQKRKVEYDDETSQDPQVSQALAQTQSLAGLKFKKVKTSHPVATTAATTATLPKSQYNVTARKRKNSEREDDSSEEEGALSDSSEDVPLAKRCKTTHPATHGPSRPAWKYGARRTQSGAGSVQRTSPLERTARRSPAPALGRRVPSIARLASKGVGAARKISDELRRRMKGFDERLASHTQTFQRRLTLEKREHLCIRRSPFKGFQR